MERSPNFEPYHAVLPTLKELGSFVLRRTQEQIVQVDEPEPEILECPDIMGRDL